MTALDPSTSTADQSELIAALQRRVDELEATVGSPSGRGRRFARVGAVTVLVVGAMLGVAGASTTPPNESEAVYTPLVPVKKVLAGATVAADKSTALIAVRGGTTTVPT